MGFLNRIMSIGKAKVNRAIEAQEDKDPAGQMKVKIQEQHKLINQFKDAVRQQHSDKVRHEKEDARLKDDVKRWQKNAETAMSEGDEDLARQALERKKRAEEELARTRTTLKSISAQYEKAESQLIASRKKLEEYESQVSSLEARQKSAQANKAMREATSKFNANAGSMGEIERYKQKVEDMETGLEFDEEFENKTTGADVDQKFADMERDHAVDDELEKLRKKTKKAEA